MGRLASPSLAAPSRLRGGVPETVQRAVNDFCSPGYEARRIAANIAKLPALLKGRGSEILASVNPRSPSIPSK